MEVFCDAKSHKPEFAEHYQHTQQGKVPTSAAVHPALALPKDGLRPFEEQDERIGEARQEHVLEVGRDRLLAVRWLGVLALHIGVAMMLQVRGPIRRIGVKDRDRPEEARYVVRPAAA